LPQAGQLTWRSIKGGHESGPLLGVQREPLPLDQRFRGAQKRAFEHKLTDRPVRRRAAAFRVCLASCDNRKSSLVARTEATGMETFATRLAVSAWSKCPTTQRPTMSGQIRGCQRHRLMRDASARTNACRRAYRRIRLQPYTAPFAIVTPSR